MVRNGATFDHQSDEILGVARIENPIHNGPQATVLGDMALQRCWHAWIQDLVAHRRKEAAEVGEIKGVLRIFDLPIGQESMQTCGGNHAAAALWSSFAGRKPG